MDEVVRRHEQEKLATLTEEEVYALRDQWIAENPWYPRMLDAIRAYNRAAAALRPPVVLITQHWRKGILVKEERRYQPEIDEMEERSNG